MSIAIFGANEAKAASFAIIENAKGTQAVHDTVIAYQANRRQGNACAKTKAEVHKSGKKPWRQKGTGRARAGDAASPLWRGGGVVFGPRPRDYSMAVPKKVKRLAFRKALSARIIAGDVSVVESFDIPSGKTKEAAALLKSFQKGEKIAIVGNEFSDSTRLAARNISPLQLIPATDLNAEQVLLYRHLIIVQSAVPTIAERTRKK